VGQNYYNHPALKLPLSLATSTLKNWLITVLVEMMMPIERIEHVILKMHDLETARTFCRDVLGMEIETERDFSSFFRFID
jgi:catechol-2,3-dioxygenase